MFQRVVRYMAFFCSSATEDGERGMGRCESQPGRRVGSKSFGMMTRKVDAGVISVPFPPELEVWCFSRADCACSNLFNCVKSS